MRLTIEELKTVQLNWYSEREREVGRNENREAGRVKRNTERERERERERNTDKFGIYEDEKRHIKIYI
jgi:hypothetical protein